jgi:guanylate kinase
MKLRFGNVMESGVARYPEIANAPGHFFLVSGPSGVGKGTILEAVKQDLFLKSQMHTVRSIKTRDPRPGEETNRSDSVFMKLPEVLKMKDNQELFQWFPYAGHVYASSRKDIADAAKKGGIILFELAAKVAQQIKQAYPEKTTTVFIAPPDEATLRERLKGRGTETPAEIETRIKNATAEMALMSQFDHVIVNGQGQLQQSIQKMKSLMQTILQGQHQAQPPAAA